MAMHWAKPIMLREAEDLAGSVSEGSVRLAQLQHDHTTDPQCNTGTGWKSVASMVSSRRGPKMAAGAGDQQTHQKSPFFGVLTDQTLDHPQYPHSVQAKYRQDGLESQC